MKFVKLLVKEFILPCSISIGVFMEAFPFLPVLFDSDFGKTALPFFAVGYLLLLLGILFGLNYAEEKGYIKKRDLTVIRLRTRTLPTLGFALSITGFLGVIFALVFAGADPYHEVFWLTAPLAAPFLVGSFGTLLYAGMWLLILGLWIGQSQRKQKPWVTFKW